MIHPTDCTCVECVTIFATTSKFLRIRRAWLASLPYASQEAFWEARRKAKPPLGTADLPLPEPRRRPHTSPACHCVGCAEYDWTHQLDPAALRQA